ncbi:hypothetical protein ACFLTP_01645 [Chloroflexota bacterium]
MPVGRGMKGTGLHNRKDPKIAIGRRAYSVPEVRIYIREHDVSRLATVGQNG